MKRIVVSTIVALSSFTALGASAEPPKPRAKTTADARAKKVEPVVEEVSVPTPAPQAPPASPPFTVICATPAAAPAATTTTTSATAPTSSKDKTDADKTEPEPIPLEGTKLEAVIGHVSKGLGIAAGIQVMHVGKKGLVLGGTAVYQETDTKNVRAIYTLGEIGYEFRAGDVKIMPYVGVGAIDAIVSVGGDTKTDTSPVVAPAFAARYEIGQSGFGVGAEARLLYLTDADQTALALHAMAGYRF